MAPRKKKPTSNETAPQEINAYIATIAEAIIAYKVFDTSC